MHRERLTLTVGDCALTKAWASSFMVTTLSGPVSPLASGQGGLASWPIPSLSSASFSKDWLTHSASFLTLKVGQQSPEELSGNAAAWMPWNYKCHLETGTLSADEKK